MKFDLTPFYMACGIGLTTYLILRFRRIAPDVKFREVRYDKHKNEIQLIVENVSAEPVYVKPAVRVVRLTPADEWKQKTNSDSPVPMMQASAGSVIKGYDLVGEYAIPVRVEPKATRVITYPVRWDLGLKAYDNIKVDSKTGAKPETLDGTLSGTLRINISDALSDEHGGEPFGSLVPRTASNALSNPAPLLDGGLESQKVSASPIDGGVLSAPAEEPKLTSCKSDFPVKSMCYCCGKDKWLSWVVGGNHVCQECKDFLGKDSKLSDGGLSSEFEEDFEPGQEVGVEMIDNPPADLKPRHRKILDILYNENTVSIKELAGILGRGQKSVAEDMRFLLRNNLVDRVKIGGKYKYFSLRDSQQFILVDSNETQAPEPPELT